MYGKRLVAKVWVGNEVRRFALGEQQRSSLAALKSTLNVLCKSSPSTQWNLWWKDNEGDLIKIANESDWKEAIRFHLKEKACSSVLLLHAQAISTVSSSAVVSSSNAIRAKIFRSAATIWSLLKKVIATSQPNTQNPFPPLNWPRLSSPISALQSHYNVVVVGSGYGASISALRTSQAGQSVCVLEKGKELLPGEYPHTGQEALAAVQLTLPDGSVWGDPTGFLEYARVIVSLSKSAKSPVFIGNSYIISKNVFVWRGCGLGGGSLVNSNVSIMPDERIFQLWPPEIMEDNMKLLMEGYQRAWQMLTPEQYPNQSTKPLAKLAALETAAANAGIGGQAAPAYVNVTFQQRVNRQGLLQPGCVLCGDCNTGCNYGAKNTLLANYLPAAKQSGAEIYTTVAVQTVQPINGGQQWQINALDLSDPINPQAITVTADIVMLGAGSLGTTEILLRSRDQFGLPLSPMLGSKFGADGDFFGIVYNATSNCDDIGYGPNPPQEMYTREGPVGPCICGVWDFRSPSQPLADGLVIEDMAFPGAFADLLMLLPGGSLIFGTDTDPATRDEKILASLQSLLEGAYTGATRASLLLGGMSTDDQAGTISLNSTTDGPVITWPTAINKATNDKYNAMLLAASKALGADFIVDPLAKYGMEPCVHPLGGCVMGTSADNGVVNHAGQVFNANTGTSVYGNLYCVDGSIVPTPLQVNPLWTISALAERICAIMAQNNGWQVDYNGAMNVGCTDAKMPPRRLPVW